MRARFIGDPRNGGEGALALSSFGVDFVKGEWTPIPAAVVAKLQGNHHFEIDTDEDGEPGPTIEELREALSARGIRFHHKAGVSKLQQLLAESEG